MVEEIKERDRGERKMKESEETEEITFPLYSARPCPTVSQSQLDSLVT